MPLRNFLALVNRRPSLLQQNGTRPYITHMIQNKLQKLVSFEVMSHPAYSLDLDPFGLLLVLIHGLLPALASSTKRRWKSQWRCSLSRKTRTAISMGSKNQTKRWFWTEEYNSLYFEYSATFIVTWRIKQISYQNIPFITYYSPSYI